MFRQANAVTAMAAGFLMTTGCGDGSTGTSDQVAAEQAIRGIVQATENALNARDFEAFFSFYSEDSDLIVFDAPRASGPSAAQQLMEQAWTAIPSDVRADLTVRAIRFVTPEVAIVDIDGVFTGSEPSHDRATVVFAHGPDGWRVEATRVIQPEVGLAAARAGIDATWDAFEAAWESGDLDTVVGFYTDDVVNMPSLGQTQSGRAEIEAAFGELFDNGTFDIVERVTTEVGGQGTIAYELGTLEQTYTSNDGERAAYAMRYVSVFHLEPDGVWRFHRWMAQQGAPGG